ncbi:MAG: nucleotide modification associated domain-containing protein [archaeon]
MGIFDTVDESKHEKHKELTEKLHETYIKKNQDYGDSFGALFDRYGLVSSDIRLTDKLNRFRQLIQNEAEVKDESIKDTLLDLANYAIMTVIELDK